MGEEHVEVALGDVGPVWLISSGAHPFARAWSTSPGEQASIPTARRSRLAEPSDDAQDRRVAATP